jgi:hypothetical protein
MADRRREGEGENPGRGREPRWREHGLQGPGRPRRGGSYQEDPDRSSRRGYLGPDELQPGYQAGRGRGYATEQAFGGRYATGQDLFRDERGVRGPEGAWGGARGGARRPPLPASPPRSHPGERLAPYPEWRQGGPHAGRGPRDYRRADERIAEELCDELMRHPEVDPSDMSVEVREGEVHLTGSVPDRWTKFVVEEMADTMLGVRDVHNQLRVRRPEEEEEGPRSLTSRSHAASGEGGGVARRRGAGGSLEKGGRPEKGEKPEKRRAKGSSPRGAAKKEPGLH